MSVPSLLLPFVLVVVLLTVTPGPDMVLVLRNGASGGTTAAWRTGLGCCTGIGVYACAAVLGLSALLAASVTAFTVIRLAGAAYLVWLGATALWASFQGRRAVAGSEEEAAAVPVDAVPVDAVPVDAVPVEAEARGGYYRQGLLTNLLNPKIALLFLTLLPQFVATGERRVATTAELAVVFLLIALLWWRLFSLAVGRLGGWLSRTRVRTVLDRATGSVLIGLGIRVALQHR